MAIETYTIEDIRLANEAAGKHWFDESSMRFFRTRIYEPVYHGTGGVFFVTSEKSPDGERRYSVRQFHPETGDVDTHGEFNSHRGKAAADRASKRAASGKDGTE
jgi:hypothetical protein